MADMSKISERLAVENIEELAESLKQLSVDQLSSLKAQLCPEGAAISGDEPEDMLRYWIENDPHPTREALQEKVETYGIDLPGMEINSEAQGASVDRATGMISRIVGTLSGRARDIVKGRGGKPLKTKDVRALIDACGSGDIDTVIHLLDKIKPNVSFRRQTPLLAACLMGHLEIVKYLVAQGADVQFTITGRDGQPPLNAASSRGHYEVVEYLLDRGASVNAVDGEEQTALHEAVFQGYPKVARLLIERGANIERKSDDGSTPLMVASIGGNLESVKLLLDRGAKASVRTPKYDRTPLHNSASRGQAEVVDLLLKAADCHINDQDKVGATPLIMAVRGHVNRHDPQKMLDDLRRLSETVHYLVNARADLNIQTKDGKTALMYAAMDSRYSEAEVLVNAGADLNIQDLEKGWSAIFFAAEKADVRIAQLLYDSGANLQLLDKKRKTVFHVAKLYSRKVHTMLTEKRLAWESETISSERETGDFAASAAVSTVSVTEDVFQPFLTKPQIPSFYKFDKRYPGMRFFGTPWSEQVTSEGAVIREWGEEIGIEFDIPPGAVPQGKKLDLSVWPCSAGPFQLPDDYVLASPVFLVSPNFEFSIDITVTVHHFYVLDTREDCDDMAFLSSPATPGDHQKPVYQLKVLSKGTFEPTEECGRVALRHFCLLTAGKRKRKSREEANSSKRAKEEKRYVYMVYKEKDFGHIAVFSAFPKVPQNSKVLKQYMEETYSWQHSVTTDIFSIEGDKIELEWPEETLWKITSDRSPCEITIEQMDLSEMIPYPPLIELTLEVKQPLSVTQHTLIEVNVLGTKKGRKFTLKPKPQQSYGSFHSSSSSDPYNSPPSHTLVPTQLPYGHGISYPHPFPAYGQAVSPHPFPSVATLMSSTYAPGQTASPHLFPSTHGSVQTAAISSQYPSHHPLPSPNPGLLHTYEPTSIVIPPSREHTTMGTSSLDTRGNPCTLRDLLNNVRTDKWYRLGVQLTENVEELNIIKSDHQNDVDGALIDMFNLVLKDNPDLSWQTVVEALQTIGENNKAKRIKKTFCGS